MTKICLALITIYQRFISPNKGFRCAHHQLHRQQTCSNAVKLLISEHGLIAAWPRIRLRFSECRQAMDTLARTANSTPRSDIACDLPCDVSLGDCGLCGGDNSQSFSCCADALYCGGPDVSRKTWRRMITLLSVIVLTSAYWFYGRGVYAVTVIDHGAEKQNLFTRVTQRQYPEVRIQLVVDGRQYYSEIVQLNQVGTEYRLAFDRGPLAFKLDELTVLDARVQLGGDLLVVGQVLEAFPQPAGSLKGQRFEYRIERRWHFF